MRTSLILVALLLTARTAVAQKAPELGYVFPPAMRAGTTTDVKLGGYNFTPDMQFFVHDERIKLTVVGPPGEFLIPKPPYWFGPKGSSPAMPIAREVPARITVPANMPPGLVRWQVANANGASLTGVFYVSDGSEILEKRDRDKPQLLKSLPVAVCGHLSRIAEEDRYRFTAQKDGPVTVELFARRLGADFHGVLEVRDDRGHLLTDVADTEGLDTALTFVAKAGRSYEVKLCDVDFRGNPAFIYRLALTAGPRVVTTIPAAGRRGETREVEFIGYGVATGKPQLETVKRRVTFPADPRQAGFRYQLQTPFGTAPAIEIPLSDHKETAATASKRGQPVAFPLPGAVTARMSSDGVDEWTFTAKKGETLRIECQSRAIGTRLDPSLTIHDAKGKQRAANDDLKGSEPDAGLNFKVPADGTYLCRVSDMSGRAGNSAAFYRLAILRPQPSFELSAPQQLKVPLTGKAALTVTAVRHGGFKGEIGLSVSGLPADMTVPRSLTIPAGKNSVKIDIERSKNAASHAALVRIKGTATIDGQTVSQPVLASAAGNLCPRDPVSQRTDAILLATTMKPPFSLELVDKNRQRAVHRGTTYPAEFVIRRDEGFTGEVLLQMLAKQSRHRQGIHGPTITAGPMVDRILYPCFLPEWLETDRTTRMVVLGVAKVRDPKGKIRYLTKPADARITMILEGALLKVAQHAKELTVNPGEGFAVPVTVSRSAKLPLPVKVELVAPRPIAGLVVSKSLTLEPGSNEAVLKVQTRHGKLLHGRWTLLVKATALKDGKWPVVSQTTVTVEFR